MMIRSDERNTGAFAKLFQICLSMDSGRNAGIPCQESMTVSGGRTRSLVNPTFDCGNFGVGLRLLCFQSCCNSTVT